MGRLILAPRIFLVAGESSGDQLGAALMRALKKKTSHRISFSGVGGPLMAAEGLDSLFPSSEIAIMGPAAILKTIRNIFRRLRETVERIVAENPDVLVVIDSPEFTQRVAKRARKRMPHLKIVKYVAPQVWAWRQGRARRMRAYIDEILALFPFEPEFYRRSNGPQTVYVGHPLIARKALYALQAEDEAERAARPPILAILPGSRISEITRLLPVFGETLAHLQEQDVPFRAFIPAIPHLHSLIAEKTRSWKVDVSLVEGEENKWKLFRRSRAALAASGTATLELALAKVPMLVGYKVEAWLEPILRRMIKVDTIVLPNLILRNNVVPEFHQREVRAELLAPKLAELLEESAARQRQMEAFDKLLQILGLPDSKEPSEEAAERVLEMMPAYLRDASGT